MPFRFAVSASGVQIDARISAVGDDYQWDAVWESAVRIEEGFWAVELRIPFSAIRFPKKAGYLYQEGNIFSPDALLGSQRTASHANFSKGHLACDTAVME